MAVKLNENLFGINAYQDYMLYLYEQVSGEEFPTEINVPSEKWFPYIDATWKYCGYDTPRKIITGKLPTIQIENTNPGVLVGFSGGRDSSTVAALQKDLGIPTILYYVKNSSRSYGHEYTAAKEVAECLEQELIVEPFTFTGKSARPDNPIKDQLFLTMGFQYMIERGWTTSTMGVFPDDTFENTSAIYGLSDVYEMFLMWEEAIQETFPQYKFTSYFLNATHETAYLLRYHSELVDLVQSCVLPDRFRKRVRETNERKYNMKISKNRCLSCQKCAKDYLIMHMFNYKRLDKRVLTEKIFPQLMKDLAHVDDGSKSASNMTIEEIIEAYHILPKYVQKYLNDPKCIGKDLLLQDVQPYITKGVNYD